MKRRLKRKLSERKRLHAIRKYDLPWPRRTVSNKEEDELKLKRSLTLQEELESLRKQDNMRERTANLKSMGIGFGAFLAFWFVGALIFHLVEVFSSEMTADVALALWRFTLFLLCVCDIELVTYLTKILFDNWIRRLLSQHSGCASYFHRIWSVGGAYDDNNRYVTSEP